ncbi:EAL domain-containing protein [Allochromatium tepidum]|uniref:EAL domain-containing protein n=1 Tax=Allochromatium tepidum TaxID=553982 RepID=UPI001BD0F2F2
MFRPIDAPGVVFGHSGSRPARDEKSQTPQIIEALGAAIATTDLLPGSMVFEVRRSAFDEAAEGLEQLLALISKGRHGLLVEDLGLGDSAFIESHHRILTHVKLSRDIMHGLVDGPASQTALDGFVRTAHKQGRSRHRAGRVWRRAHADAPCRRGRCHSGQLHEPAASGTHVSEHHYG